MFGSNNAFARFFGKIFKIRTHSAGYVEINGIREYYLKTAITHNVTPTTAPAGSYARTSNVTGRGKLFYSDGAKWQSVTGA